MFHTIGILDGGKGRFHYILAANRDALSSTVACATTIYSTCAKATPNSWLMYIYFLFLSVMPYWQTEQHTCLCDTHNHADKVREKPQKKVLNFRFLIPKNNMSLIIQELTTYIISTKHATSSLHNLIQSHPTEQFSISHCHNETKTKKPRVYVKR